MRLRNILASLFVLFAASQAHAQGSAVAKPESTPPKNCVVVVRTRSVTFETKVKRHQFTVESKERCKAISETFNTKFAGDRTSTKEVNYLYRDLGAQKSP